MALVVQDDNGGVEGANGYIDRAFFKAYLLDRGVDVDAAYSFAQQDAAIIEGCDFEDHAYRYIGTRQRVSQTTEWPRFNVVDEAQHVISGVPQKIKEANAELGWKVLQGVVLFPDQTFDPVGEVRTKSEQVGPIRESTTYADKSAGGRYPSFPKVERMLREFRVSGQGQVFRA